MLQKSKRSVVFVVCEGYFESYFLEHLESYSNVSLNKYICNGKNADKTVNKGFSYLNRYKVVYLFFDEDFETKSKIKRKTLEKLTKLKPQANHRYSIVITNIIHHLIIKINYIWRIFTIILYTLP